MAKIFYGVCGEGNGHAIRSKIIIEELKKMHTVHIFSHGKGHRYLKQFFPVHRILGFHMYYINNKVSSILTGTINILKFPLMALASLQYPVAFLKEKPDILITDFEPFIAYWAKIFDVPYMSIDNQHSITNTAIDKIPGQWLNELYSKLVIWNFFPKPKYTLITTFFETTITKKNTVLVPPIIKPEILRSKSSNKGHIFVYQTSQSYKKMFSVLKKSNKQFLIYGFEKEEQDGNVTFRKFNNEQYAKDLAAADAVIINGGFTTLTEALYLQKPIFSIPIKRQFEQIINGYYLQKLCYGTAVKRITEQNLQEFLEKKEGCRNNIKKIKWDKNKKFFEILQKNVMFLKR